MFGYARPDRDRLSSAARGLLTASYCGLCARLRTHYGLWSCLIAGYDALFPVLLVASQGADPPELGAPTRCPYRAGLSSMPTLANLEALDYGAAITGLLVSERVADWRRDERLLACLGRGLATRVGARGAGLLRELGLCPERIVALKRQQARVEEQCNLPIDAALEPSGQALAIVFGDAARLAGRPDDVAPLQAIGRSVGRLVALADACEDLRRDRRTGSYNPLLAGQSVRGPLPISLFVNACQSIGREVCDLRAALDRTEIIWLPELVNGVLCQGLPRRVGVAVQALWTHSKWRHEPDMQGWEVSQGRISHTSAPNVWFWNDLDQAPELAAELGYPSAAAYVLTRVLAVTRTRRAVGV